MKKVYFEVGHVKVQDSTRKAGKFDVIVGGLQRFTKATLKGAISAAKRIEQN